LILNRESRIVNPESLIGNPESLIGNPESLIGNPESLIVNPESLIGNPESLIGNPESLIGNPESESRIRFNLRIGHWLCSAAGMANTLEELPIYEEVQKLWNAVNEILQTPALRKDRDLHQQIADANDSIDANMKEGFEQPTDVAFANFVFTAKGSTAEVIARMKKARRKNLISDAQLEQVEQLAVPLGKMMGGFIKYLSESGFTDRGRHGVAPTPPRPRNPRRR
jgi:four helix bundle protein